MVQANVSGITGVDGDATYTVTVSGITGDGLLGLELLNTGTGIINEMGNALFEGIRTGTQHVVGYAFDVSKAIYNGDGERFYAGGQESSPFSMAFNNDGTRMYVLGPSGDDINEYHLTEPYDVSTADYAGDGERFSIVEQEDTPYSLVFNGDGTRMYVMGVSGDDINEYDLSTAYDVSTAVYAGSSERFYVGVQEASPLSLTFNADGTKMYVMGSSGDDINEYDLSTAYDVSTAVYAGDGERFSVGGQETDPISLAFNANGTKMYVMGTSGDDIIEYDLGTPYDVSTAVYAGDGERFSVGSQDTTPRSLAFNGDGTRMYIVGDSGDDINEYTLVNRTPEIGGINSDQTVDVDMTISPFQSVVLSDANNDLLTATITLDDNAKGVLTGGAELTGTGPYHIATPVDAVTLQGYLQALVFDPAMMGVATFTLQINDGLLNATDNTTSVDVIGYPLVSAISLVGSPPSNATSVDVQINFDEPVNGVDISDFVPQTSSLVQANVSGITGADGDATYTVTVSGITGDGVVGLELLDTGTGIMDATGNALGEGIRKGGQHVVGYAFDVSKAIYNGDGERFYVGSQETTPYSLTFNDDGTRMYILGSTGDDINEYNLSTAYDVSTAVYAGDGERFYVGNEELNPTSLVFNADGTRMYVLGRSEDYIFEYALNEAYDVSTAIYVGGGFSVAGQENDPYSFAFNNGGTRIAVVGISGDQVNEYQLSIAYDLSTATYTGSLDVSDQETNPFSLIFNANGTRMFIGGLDGDDINEYQLGTPYDVSTAVYSGDNERFFVGEEGISPRSIAFNNDGTMMYIISQTDDVYEYTILNYAPEIGGTNGDQIVDIEMTISPFQSVALSDANNDLLTATITLDDNAKGVLTGGMELSGTDPYHIATPVDAATLQGYLQSLVFEPAYTTITTFTLEINDGALTTEDNATSVLSTSTPTALSINRVGNPSPNDLMLDFEVTFSEPVVNVDVSDFALVLSGTAAASISSLSGNDGDAVYTVTINNISGTGTLRLDLNDSGTGIEDIQMTPVPIETGFSDGEIHSVDTDEPSATVSTNSSLISLSNLAIEVAVMYDESMDPTTEPTITFGTSVNFTSDGPGSWSTTNVANDTWIQTFNHNGEAEEISAETAIVVDGSGATDVVGNAEIGDSSPGFSIDTQAPTGSIELDNASLIVGETGLVTITFSEAVTGFDNTDLTIPNSGTLSAVNSSDGGVTWMATFTPNTDTESPTNVISVDLGGVTDEVGNVGAGATSTDNFEVDTQAPTGSIEIDDAGLTVGETGLVTVTFSEAVTGFDNTDLAIPNSGTLSAVNSSDGGVTWTATFTPNTDTESATNVISMDLGGVTDEAGNSGAGTTSTDNFEVDTQAPTGSIEIDDASLTVGETGLLTVTFSEAVTGFDNTDLTIPSSGTLSAVNSSDEGVTWTATFTPNADTESATNVISVDLGEVTDEAGNAGTGTTSTDNFEVDTQAPTGIIETDAASLTSGETSLVTITFLEVVTGFDNTDLTIPNSGTLSAVSSSDGGVTWTATFTPNVDTESASNVIELDRSGVTDLAGNAGSGTASTDNFEVDTQAPTGSIEMDAASLIIGETSLVTITFSEAVTGFDNTYLTIPNSGTLSEVSSSDGGVTWTASFTPNIDIESAMNVISVDLGGVTDEAGNAGTGTTSTDNFEVDTQAPMGSVEMDDVSLTIGETSLVTITFSEAVTGFDNTDLTIPNSGTLSEVSSSDGGVTWTATFNPNVDTESATNVISVDIEGVIDGLGNTGAGIIATNNFEVDTKSPTAAVTVDSQLISADNLTQLVTVTYDESMDPTTNPKITFEMSTQFSSMGDGAWDANNTRWSETFKHAGGEEEIAAETAIVANGSGAMDVAGNPEKGNSSLPFSIGTTVLSIEDMSAEKISAYPNPAGSVLQVSLSRILFYLPVNIKIYELSGREVLKIDNIERRSFDIDVSHLSQGTHVLEINSGNIIERQRIIIKRN